METKEKNPIYEALAKVSFLAEVIDSFVQHDGAPAVIPLTTCAADGLYCILADIQNHLCTANDPSRYTFTEKETA